MIHYTPEGSFIKLGLNFSFTPGGFRFMWAWYDFASHNAVTYRLRLRLFGQPAFMWAVNRFNVIEAHLMRHGLELVNSEILADLKATERDRQRINEPLCYVKPVRETDARA